MQGPGRRTCTGQREIERCKGSEVGGFKKTLLRVLQSGRDRGTQVVEKFPDDGTFFLWHIPHSLAERGDRPAFAKVFQTGGFERSGIMSQSNKLKGLAAKGINLLLHRKN
jgi:hypothetical protein